MSSNGKGRPRNRRGQRHRQGWRRLALARGGICRGGRRAPPGAACRRSAREVRGHRQGKVARRADRHRRPRGGEGALRQDEGDVRAARLLFNNAGGGTPAVRSRRLPVEQWQRVVAVNLTGVFLCTQEAMKIMKDQQPTRRTDHQQRLDLGVCAAAHSAPTPRPSTPSPASPNRPRSMAANTTSACGQIDIGNALTEMNAANEARRAAGARRDHRRADDGRAARRGRDRLHGHCRWTPMCSS